MAAIFQGIDSDISKLRQLQGEIDKLKKKLQSIDVNVNIDIAKDLEGKLQALTSQFDTLAAKVQSTNARMQASAESIINSSNKITEANNKMAESAAKLSGQKASETLSSPSTNVEATKQQTQANEELARSYEELKAALDSIGGTAEQNSRIMAQEQIAIKVINGNISALNKTIKIQGYATSEQTNALARYNQALSQHQAALSEARSSLMNQAKLQNVAKGSMDEMAQSLSRMRIVYRSLNEEERNGAFGKELLASIQQADAKIKELDATIGNHQRNVGNYASGFGGLNMAVQQVVRELPSATMGLNMFFMAISNNLPILADQIKALSAANKEAKASGQSTVPVWKALISSIFSWQTAMMVGITLLTVYGSKIAEWGSNLFKGKDALAAAKQAQVQFNEDMKKASDTYTQTLSSNAARNISKYQSLSESYKRLGNNISAQKKFIDANQEAFRELGLSIHDVRTANQALISDKAKMIDYFMTTARAAAYQATMVQLMQKQIGLKLKQYNAPNRMTLSEMAGYGIKATKEQGYGNKNLSMLNMMTRKVTLTPEQQRQYVAQREDWKADQIEVQKLNKQIQNLGNSAANTNMKLDKLKGSLSYVNSGSSESKNGNTRRSTSASHDYTKDISNQIKAATDAYQKLQDSLSSLEKTTYDEVSSASIEAMKNSSEKEIAQIRLDAENKKKEIQKSQTDIAKQLLSADYKSWKASNIKGNWNQYVKQTGRGDLSYWLGLLNGGDLSKSGLNEQQQKLILEFRKLFGERMTANEAITNIKLDKIRQDAVNSMNEYLSEYGSYQEKRLALTELYNDKIAKAANEGEKKILQAQLNDKLKDLDFSEFKKSIHWEDMFGNLDVFNYSTLERLRKQLKEYISKAAGSIKPTDLKTLTDALNNIDLTEVGKNPFASFGKALDNYKSASDKVKQAQYDLNTVMKGGEIITGIYTDKTGRLCKTTLTQTEAENNLNEAQRKRALTQDVLMKSTDAVMSSLTQSMKIMQTALSNLGQNDAANAIGTMLSTTESLSNAFDSFKKGGFKNILSGIGDVVGAVTAVFGMAIQANERHHEALKQIMTDTIAQQQQYNLLLLQQNELYKEGTTIFGTDIYAKALNSVKVMKDAQDDLNKALIGTAQQQERFSSSTYNSLSKWEKVVKGITDSYSELKDQYSGLADVQIVTGHKKTGLFGWGKGKDTYSSVLDVYPELIDQNGKFNTSLAETIIQTRKLDDTSKNALQHVIDLSKQADESWKSVTDYLTDIFGQLGNDITNILKDSFVNGTDAAQQMCDSVSSMLETLAQQMVYSFAFQDIFSNAQKQIEEIMKNDSLDSAGKFTSFTDVFKSMTDQMMAAVPEAEKLMEWMKQYGETKGFDLFSDKQSEASTNNTVKANITESQADFIGAQLMGGNASWNAMNEKMSIANKYANSLVTIAEDNQNMISKAVLYLQSIDEKATKRNDMLVDIKDRIDKMIPHITNL